MESQVIHQVKYSVLKSEQWGQLIGKLSHTPTAAAKAAHIKKLINAISVANDFIASDFKGTMLDKFAKKNEDGTLVTPEGPDSYEIIEEKTAEFQEALKPFGEQLVEVRLEGRPLTPDTLSDVKMSAAEMELLGNLYCEQNGPGVPHLQSV